MGMWALDPWDNDGAADWYGDLMDKTKLRSAWLEGISADPVESPDIVRAAAALFVMLGRVYVWPIKKFDEDLEKAISALERVVSNDSYQEAPELVQQISREIEELKSRRKPAQGGEAVKSAKPWWAFWK